MNQPTPTTPEHTWTWELLPWLVNGRLDAADRSRVEEHLRGCDACRDEVVLQRSICDALAADATVEQMPVASLNKLRERLDRLAAEPPAPLSTSAAPLSTPAVPEAPRPAAAAPHRSALSRRRALSVAASVLVAAVLLGIPGVRYWQHATHRDDPGAYYTVSSPAPQHPRAAIRAVFAPNATLGDLQGVLDDARLSIVSGPSEAGVYSLAMNGSESTAWSLQRLRAHDSVRFAEAIAPVPPPPP